MRTIQFSKVKIPSVSHNGMEYFDEDGNPSRIDFEECNKNWLRELSISLADRDSSAINWHHSCVGMRNVLARLPYIEFFTEPHTRLEFDSPDTGYDDFQKFKMELISVERITFDLS